APKKDPMRHGTSSSRSLRSSAPSFNANGSSSRNSRSSSPAVPYASLYEPPPSSTSYDMPQPLGQTPTAPYMAPWVYPFPPSGHHMPQHNLYQYYQPCEWPQRMPHSNSSDLSS